MALYTIKSRFSPLKPRGPTVWRLFGLSRAEKNGELTQNVQRG